MATKRVSTRTQSTSTPKIVTKRTKRASPTVTNGSSPNGATHNGHHHQHELVAAEAYYLAERRGFAAGHELEDWVAAEQLIAARL